MDEKNYFDGEFEVPRNYRVDIHGGPHMFFRHFKNNEKGECYIEVYKILESYSGCSLAERFIKVGDFVIEDASNLKANDFLRKIRQGIEKIVNSKREFLETIN